MFDLGSPSSEVRHQRARGLVRVGIVCRDGRSTLGDLYQDGSAKVRFPRRSGAVAAAGPLEAILLNTAGGLTGGDRLDYALSAGRNTGLVVSTQAAEKVYRSLGSDAHLQASLRLDAGAACAWLPQETILFEGARLRRSLTVEMASDAQLLALESLVYGRRAMGERALNVSVGDSWRIRRAGRLVYAEAFRLEDRAGQVQARRGVLEGAAASASLVYVAPDAEARLEQARGLLAGCDGCGVEAGASAWDGLLALRFLAREAAALRTVLAGFLERFRGAPLPRVWHL